MTVRIMLEIDVEHIKRLERLFFLSFGFSSLRRGALGNFFLLIHKELVLFIKEQFNDEDVFNFGHKVVQRFLVEIIKKRSRQSDVVHDLVQTFSLNIRGS